MTDNDIYPELGLAGARAHNRWLAELCADSSERRRGAALVQITADTEDVLAEIKRAHDSGLRAVMIPAMWMNQKPYHDKHYDPVWALCEDLQMPVVTHSGPADKDSYGDHLGIYVSEVVWWPARPLWFMLWSGVFERFPRLQVRVTEAGCWSVPNFLWFRDRLYLGHRGGEKLGDLGITLSRSETFDRNCFIGSSNTKRREIGMRYEIGLDNMLWGNDFPHPEGTWPRSREWLAKTYHDVPVAETRRMIGEAAAEVFGFELSALRPHAERLTDEMGDGRVTGRTPRARITSLLRQWRSRLLEHPHLIGLAHGRGRTPAMFQPIQAALARELAAVGVRGRRAALAVRALQVQ